ncbi:WD40-repeat-containing domain protein [Gorgonomyces haynaldii]|nr:WD40-repeat-containing domain protein [Gorgonomyces haynaldii]
MSNIFSVSFDCHESKIFSCANDGLLLRYDRERSTASNVILAHDEACLKLSCHPENEHLVLTAGQDYAVKLWDMRSESLVGRIQYMGVGFNSVEFNPISSNYFISSDDSGGILLHDLRMAFHTKRPLLRYTTKLYHKSRQSRNVDIPSATWSSDGKHIGALLQRYRPVIYTVDDPDPLVVLDTDESKGQRYQSTITIKSGSFSDSFGSLSFFAGSEHKAAYGWHIPPISDLLEQRETSELKYSTDICFIREKDQVQIKPARLPQADIVLRDHDSIVNSISCHPTLPWIVTAGVEKVVRLFSSVPLYGSEESPASSPIELNGESLEPDSEVLRYFALLVLQLTLAPTGTRHFRASVCQAAVWIPKNGICS